jgi:hypothetical protein
MTDLSPAAQAVKDAVLALYSDEKVHEFGWQLDLPTVAAALRAAADQVVPWRPEPTEASVGSTIDFGYAWALFSKTNDVRQELLAIAAELEQSL